MKAALVLAAAGAAVAQNLAGIPTCATACLSSAVVAAGCNPTDQGCQCGPTSAIIGQSAVGCLLASCNAAALATAQSVGAQLCSEYSATAGKASATTTVTTGVTASSSPATATSTATVIVTSTSTSSSSSSAATTKTVTSTHVVTNATVTTGALTTTTAAVGGAGKAAVGTGALVAFIGALLAL